MRGATQLVRSWWSVVARRGAGAAVMTACGAAAGVSLLAACDPCDGVVGCTGDPRVSVGGQIVDRAAGGAPVRGARVTVAQSGGAELGASSASAETDGQGWWHVELPARAAEGAAVTVDVTVAAPGVAKPYTVTGQTLQVSTHRGQGQVLGRWVTRPYISYIGELRDRQTNAPIAGATVTFVRRGGITFEPTPATQLTQTTSGIGYFLIDVAPSDFAPLIGDLVVQRDGQATVTLRNISIMPGHEWGPPLATAASSFRIGLGFEYFVTVYNRGPRENEPGWLTWQRTGGVPTTPERVALPSGINTVRNFVLTPAAAGDVVGDAFFEPAGTPDTVWFRGLRLATSDGGLPQYYELRYGEGLLYSGRAVGPAGSPLANTPLRFRRTGGIALVSDTAAVTTDGAGNFVLALPTRQRGTLTGELALASGGAGATLTLATSPDDAPRPLGDVVLPAPRAGAP